MKHYYNLSVIHPSVSYQALQHCGLHAIEHTHTHTYTY